jgi:hypothetical protein
VADQTLLRVPLPVMATIIAGLALLVEVLGIEARLGVWSLALLAIPGALAVVYLLEYRTLPYEPWHPRPAPTPATPSPEDDEEEFVDPVEEADRLGQTASSGADPAVDVTAGPPAPPS